jgi:hypothetical protein
MKYFIKEYVSLVLLLFHNGCRKDSNKPTAVHAIVQQPPRSEELLAQIDFLHYLLHDTYSDHITASESFSGTNWYVRNPQHLQKPLGC